VSAAPSHKTIVSNHLTTETFGQVARCNEMPRRAQCEWYEAANIRNTISFVGRILMRLCKCGQINY
jgi:hypothetical protein